MPGDRHHALAVIERIMADAEGAKNLFRGRALSATEDRGLVLSVTDRPTARRDEVIVPDAVWEEIDLNIAAVTTRRALMTKLGLGVRRGVLLAGPPGVGKATLAYRIARYLLAYGATADGPEDLGVPQDNPQARQVAAQLRK